MHARSLRSLLPGLLLLSLGCPPAQPPAPPSSRYSVTVRRTSYGIPHISANDLGSLGFGQGHALAQDHGCTLADQILKVRGERARFFGPGPNEAHLNSDFAYRALALVERARTGFASQPEDTRELVQGFVDGFNHFLASPAAAELPCAGQPWLRPLTVEELAAYHLNVTLTASGSRLIDAIAAAQPPSARSLPSPTAEPPALEPHSLASNGWALGAERSANGRGMVLANPHFPWEGELRMWECHLTVPGRLDVYGATLLGVPGVVIGFNKDVAWTHTFSAGMRFTAYLLPLVAGQPTVYLSNGQETPMTSRPITFQVLQPDGSLREVTRTAWSTREHGPLVALPGLGWSQSVAVSYRDANLDNFAFVTQFLRMNRSTSLQEFQQVYATVQGIPWVNTLAADRAGNVWYVDASATPNLVRQALEKWEQALATPDSVQSKLLAQGVVLLDGNDPLTAWLDEEGARGPGLVPFSRMPQRSLRSYVFNANDSHWLANPDAPLEGFSPLHGRERVPQSLRTRMNARLLNERRAEGASGSDFLFTLEELQAAILDNRSMSAELLLNEVVQRCPPGATGTARSRTVDLTQACAVLSAWNSSARGGRYDLDSVGAVLWRELMGAYPGTALLNAGPLFATPFSPEQPLDTPHTLAPAPAQGSDALLDRLAEAVLALEQAGVPVNAPLGQVQYALRGGQRVPVHGGIALDGTANVVSYRTLDSTLEPRTPRGTVVNPLTGLTSEGYVVNYGTSFLMAMRFTDTGLEGRAVLTYGQSGNPASPHANDQLPLFARKQWRNILFTEQDISRDPNLQTLTLAVP
jgi:acyl-homoserine-lactone acylase